MSDQMPATEKLSLCPAQSGTCTFIAKQLPVSANTVIYTVYSRALRIAARVFVRVSNSSVEEKTREASQALSGQARDLSTS